MIKTLPIDEFEDRADNIYEAIVVLAKRSRQINEDQKAVLNQGHEFDDEYDDFGEEPIPLETINREYEKLPKPASIALDEFFSGKIKYHYKETEEEEASATKE